VFGGIGGIIADGTVTGADLAVNAVSAGNLASNSVDSSKIVNATIIGLDIAPGTVANTNLVSDSVTVISGNGLINGGTVALGGTITLNIGAGNGITVNADDIAVRLAGVGSGPGAVNGNASGLEFTSGGLRLLGGCIDGQILRWAAIGSNWYCYTASSGVTTIQTIDSIAKSANGAVLSGSDLYLQTADTTNPGLVSTTTQSFSGNKTFTGNVNINGNTVIGDAVTDTLVRNAGETVNGATTLGCSPIVDAVAASMTAANIDNTSCIVITKTTTVAVTAVIGVTVSAPGSGYTTAPTVTFSGGGCTTQPTATSSVTGGLVTAVTMLTPGVGCTTAPTIAFGGPGTAAAASSILTTVNNPINIPNPTATVIGKRLTVMSSTASTVSFVVKGISLTAGTSYELIWNGSAWTTTGDSNGSNSGSSASAYQQRLSADIPTAAVQTNINDLSFYVAAGETWTFQITGLIAPTGTVATVQMSIPSIPGTPNCTNTLVGGYNAITVANNLCNTNLSGASINANDQILYTGKFTVGAVGGIATFKFNGGAGAILKRDSFLSAYRISGADLAEVYYDKSYKSVAGNIVELTGEGPSQIGLSKGSNREKAFGIVSTTPGQILGANDGTGNVVYVALAGRVPVKVTTKNGNIKPGDQITVSDIDGVGQLATTSGRVVGKALTSYSGTEIGEVVVFVEPGYWQAPVSFDLSTLISSYNSVTQINGSTTLSGSAGALGLTDIAANSTTYNGLDQQAFNQIMQGFTLQQGAILETKDRLAQITTRLSDLERVAASSIPATQQVVIGTATIDLTGSIIINQSVVFGKNVSFNDTLTVNSRVSGRATVLAGSTRVRVDFAPPYETNPLIQATPNDLIATSYRVTNITITGFDIELSAPATVDNSFTWFAVADQVQ
jgi:hypothetical protein